MRIIATTSRNLFKRHESTAGRNCPIRYHYKIQQANTPSISGDVFYIIGGLYGNQFALSEILDLKNKEESITHKEVKLLFNGDFNWFNTEKETFERINSIVQSHIVSATTFDNLILRLSKEISRTRYHGNGGNKIGWIVPSVVDVPIQSNWVILQQK